VVADDWCGRLAGAWRSAAGTWDTLFGGVVHAGLQAGGDDLISRPDLEGEGVLSVAKHGIGAIVKLLEWRNGATTAHPDEGGAEEISRQLDRLFIWDFSLYRSQVCMVFIYFR
jgi:hypothetical protein